MSLWDYVFDSEWSQRSDIEDLKRRTRNSQSVTMRKTVRQRKEIESLEERVEELEGDVGQMTLFLMATIEMLKSTGKWDNEVFHQALEFIDGRDGVKDGKASLD